MRKLFCAILCLFFLVSLSFGQEAKWVQVPKIYNQQGNSIRSDILSRLPRTSDYNFSGVDNVGFGHYGGHYMNSYMRNKYGSGFETCGVYVYGGYGFICPQPKEFTLSEVVRRGGGFFPGGSAPISSWNRQPFYVFDELVAYTYGTLNGLQCGETGYRVQGSYRFMKDMLRHSKAAVQLSYERGYPYAKEVDGFVRHMEKVQKVCIDPYFVGR